MATRIKGNDSVKDAALTISEGNIGALSLCARLLAHGEEIDPDSFAGGLGQLLSLDAEGIYGSRVWMLYKDVCGESLPDMVAMMRAVQLGFLDSGKLAHAIDSYGEGLDVAALRAQVCERLPAFRADWEETPAPKEDT